jgi:hypothetical protein
MNGFPAWLGQQARAMSDVIGAVAANHAMPARSVLVYALVFLVLAWALFWLVRKVTT